MLCIHQIFRFEQHGKKSIVGEIVMHRDFLNI